MAELRNNVPQRQMELGLLNPSGWMPRAFNQALTFLGIWFGGANSDTPGQQINAPGGAPAMGVNEDLALQVSTVWACIRLITETFGTLSVNVYERTPSGRNVVRDHPLSYVLNVAPNDRNTNVELFESWAMNLAIDGNCYSRVIRDGRGDCISLDPRASQQMAIDEKDDGRFEYTYKRGGDRVIYQPEQIFHSKLMGNGLKGLSPLGYARSTVANALALSGNALRFNQKGGKPSGVLMIDHVLKPEQRTAVRQNFADLEAGGDNGSRLFVLEAGMAYQQLSITPADAQMLQQMNFGVDEICRIFRVPSFMVNSNDKQTSFGTGIETMGQGFLTYTLMPYVKRIESSLNRWVIRAAERPRYYCEFNLESLLRADSTNRANYYSTMVQNGLMSRNEVRTKENLDRREGADELTVQLNLTPIQELMNATANGTRQASTVPTAPIKE
jgi:HK97 family phage portal protein